MYVHAYVCELEVCTGRIFQARSEVKMKISAQHRRDQKVKLKFSPEPGPDRNKLQNFGPGLAWPIFLFFPISAQTA